MKERYLLWSYPMVRAILNTAWWRDQAPTNPAFPTKTETRRIVTYRNSGGKAEPIPGNCNHVRMSDAAGRWTFCTDGKPVVEVGAPADVGDVVIGRERWSVPSYYDDIKPSLLPNTVIHGSPDDALIYAGDYVMDNTEPGEGYSKWRPSIFLPRRFCRLAHEVTSIHPERLWSIPDDAFAKEGFATSPGSYAEGFAAGWDKINGHRDGCRWGDNPWVWVIGLRRLEKPPEKP